MPNGHGETASDYNLSRIESLERRVRMLEENLAHAAVRDHAHDPEGCSLCARVQEETGGTEFRIPRW